VRAALIIVEPPGFDDVLGLGHRGELVHVQTFVSQAAVKGFKDSMKAFSTGLPGRIKSSCTPRPYVHNEK